MHIYESEKTRKRERSRCLTLRGLHHFHSKQKAQDKLDNLAAKPFFLGIISSSSLLSHPSRERMLRATLVPFPADNTYILSLSRSLPILVVPSLVSLSFLSFSLTLSHGSASRCLASPKSGMTDSAVRGVDVCRTDETQERIFVRLDPREHETVTLETSNTLPHNDLLRNN